MVQQAYAAQNISLTSEIPLPVEGKAFGFSSAMRFQRTRPRCFRGAAWADMEDDEVASGAVLDAPTLATAGWCAPSNLAPDAWESLSDRETSAGSAAPMESNASSKADEEMVIAAELAACEQCILPPGVPTLGSLGHGSQACQPCKYAHKARGCKDGWKCTRCHLCSFFGGRAGRSAKERRQATAKKA